jgi:hypothetical protein
MRTRKRDDRKRCFLDILYSKNMMFSFLCRPTPRSIISLFGGGTVLVVAAFIIA